MKLRVFKGEGAFDRAAQTKQKDQSVCGVITHTGAPAYFLMPVDATSADVQQASFFIREGRAMGEGEENFVAAFNRRQQHD